MDVFSMSVLPTEILEYIFGFLNAPALCAAGAVCRRWREVIDGHPRLWKTICHKYCDQNLVTEDREAGLRWKVRVLR